MYEQQREHARGARFNLETQLLAIENADVNMETLKAMKAGSATMRNMHGELDVGKVDATMDDIREQMDLANEINAAISTPLVMDLVDEEELDAELEQIEQAEMDKAMLGMEAPPGAVKSASSLPPVSVSAHSAGAMPTEPANTKNDEDAELEELRASMAL